MGRIRTSKICELEDREVSSAEVGKGYEYARDQVVAISDDELRDLPRPTLSLPRRPGLGQALRPDDTALEEPV
ncbi:Ku protein [Streptomyces asoensis]